MTNKLVPKISLVYLSRRVKLNTRAKPGNFFFDSKFIVNGMNFNKSNQRFFGSVERINKGSLKLKVKSIYMYANQFNENYLIEVLNKAFIMNNTYSLLIKVQYTNTEGHSLYCMLDEQIGIVYNSKECLNNIITSRFIDLKDKLAFYMYKYDAVEVDLIQIMYIVNNSFKELRLKNINKEYIDKNIVNIKQTKKVFSNNMLPLTTNEIYYGTVLVFEIDTSGKYVSKLLIGEIDFISQVKKKNLEKGITYTEFDSDTRFYLYTVNDEQYVITVKTLDENNTVKEVYNLSGYKIISNIKDKVLDKNRFTRNIDNVSIEFEVDKVTKKSIKVRLPVFKLKPTRYKGMANPSIGTFDMETYKDLNSIPKVYALGFATLDMLKDNKSNLYYLTKDESSYDIIVKCIDDMLSVKYRDHIYYTHNLGGYDIVFLLKVLKQANQVKGFEYYKIETILRDSKILKCVVRVKTPSGHNKITLVDSYNLLTDNLDNLSKSFGSQVKKGLFPYSFVTSNTLNYIGNTPSRDYYIVRNKKVELEHYNTMFRPDWNLKLETLKYLERDLLSLLEIIDTFNKYIYIEYGVQVTESMTISRLALNIFIKNYLKNSLLPVINNKSVFSSIKQAYYGGVVEVYKPAGKNLKYYDVNSLYPFAAKNTMPGHICEYIESKNALDLNELFGFFYAKVKTNNGYLGLLPVHQKGLIMPNGVWYGWYFSEELKFAKDNGYEIEVFKGYKFNKVDNVFTDYVDNLFNTKSTSTGSVKLITKFLLNSLLGRFGMSILKLQTEIVSVDKYLEILSCKAVNSVKYISDTDMLISFSNIVSRKVTREHGLDYVEILNHNSSADLEKTNSFEDVAVSISAAVTAYARIYMSSIKLDILKKGGEIFYTDTDSIVTNIDLPKELVGNQLGQFKLEYIVKQAYFISAKTYCLVLDDQYIKDKEKAVVIKAKGVFDNSLTLDDFKSMYYDKKSIEAIKSNTETNYLEGYVDIGTKKVKLNADAYSKREKLYTAEGLWIDTKALEYFG